MIEAVLGQVFIATTLARLVSLYKSGGALTESAQTAGLEAVAHPRLGEEVARLRRVRLELAAHVGEMDADVAALVGVLRPPHLLAAAGGR